MSGGLQRIFGEPAADLSPQNLGRMLLAEMQTETPDIGVAMGLLARGAVPDEKDGDGTTALMWAAMNAPERFIRAQLDAGADVNKKSNNGMTALMLAARDGRADIVRVLLDAGAIVDEVNRSGMTVRQLAALNKQAAVVQMIDVEAERRLRASEVLRGHEAWVRAGMPVDRPKNVKPLKLKGRG